MATEAAVEKVIADLVLGGACREAARRFAGKYGSFDQAVVVKRIVAASEGLSKGHCPEPQHELPFDLGFRHSDDNERIVEVERLK